MAAQQMETQLAAVFLRYEPGHFAERLRIKRGGVVHVTGFDGQPSEWRVDRVGMPDAGGNVRVDVSLPHS